MFKSEKEWAIAVLGIVAIIYATVGAVWWIDERLIPSRRNAEPVIVIPSGCICGEPRDDARRCGVYVDILSDNVAEVWTDASPEELEGVTGVEWANDALVSRDPRYGWETVFDGICALGEPNE